MSLEDIKKNLKTEKLVLGSEKTMKLLKLGKLAKVIMSANVPKNVEEDITYYSNLNKTEIEKVKLLNTDLGTYVKKPFSVSVIGLLK